MKICSSCKEEKPLDDFAWKVKNRRKQSSCKECIRNRIRQHYHNNKQQYAENRKNRQLQLRGYVHSYLKNHPCIDCGEKDPACLDFDHLKDKCWSICECVKRRQSISTIKREIEKCVVRCANCHRKKTAKDQNWYYDL